MDNFDELKSKFGSAVRWFDANAYRNAYSFGSNRKYTIAIVEVGKPSVLVSVEDGDGHERIEYLMFRGNLMEKSIDEYELRHHYEMVVAYIEGYRDAQNDELVRILETHKTEKGGISDDANQKANQGHLHRLDNGVQSTEGATQPEGYDYLRFDDRRPRPCALVSASAWDAQRFGC